MVANAEKVSAQTANNDGFPLNPPWVKMMTDPNVNYYEAVKAYEDFWKGREKPNNEAEEMEQMVSQNHSGKMTDKERKKMEREEREHKREMERELKKKWTEEELKELEWKREMTYQCKRFEQWMRDSQPYIQNDGRILTQDEKMRIYEQRQRELNNK